MAWNAKEFVDASGFGEEFGRFLGGLRGPGVGDAGGPGTNELEVEVMVLSSHLWFPSVGKAKRLPLYWWCWCWWRRWWSEVQLAFQCSNLIVLDCSRRRFLREIVIRKSCRSRHARNDIVAAVPLANAWSICPYVLLLPLRLKSHVVI